MQLRIRPQQKPEGEISNRGSFPKEALGCRCGHNQAMNKEKHNPGFDIGDETADAFPVLEPQDLQNKQEDDDI